MTLYLFLFLAAILFFFLKMRMVFIFCTVLLLGALLKAGTFIVYEGSQVVLTQFGRIVSPAYQTAGLYFKVPFLWKANYFDKRIYTDIEYQTRAVTKDRYFVYLDLAVNWRISDPVTFFIKISGADDEVRVLIRHIVSGSVREVIASHNLVETIRSKYTYPISTLTGSQYFDSRTLIENNANSEKSGKTIGRRFLSDRMKQSIRNYTKDFGIEILSILLTDIRYSKEVEERVYQRMIFNQLRKAEELRSTGLNAYYHILGLIERKKQEILSPARKKSLIIRGKADAVVTDILAKSYGSDPSFYNFWQTLKYYEKTIPANSNGLIMSTDNDFLKLLRMRNGLKAPPLSPQKTKSKKGDSNGQ